MGKPNKKQFLAAIGATGGKDAAAWCEANAPCPKGEDLSIEFAEVVLLPPPARVVRRTVPARGHLPFDLTEKNLTGVNFAFVDLRRFVEKTKGVVERKTNFSGAKLASASFRGTNCSGTQFTKATLVDASFDGAILAKCYLDNCMLDSASFMAATCTRMACRISFFSRAKWDYSNCEQANFDESYACLYSKYKEAQSNPALGNDVAFWAGSSFKNCSMVGASFRKAKLCGCDFSGANLSGVCFVDADLRFCNFAGANLTGANFNGANLQNVVGLDSACLRNAVMFSLTIPQTSFAGHKDVGSILFTKDAVVQRKANLMNANFAFCDLSGADLSFGLFDKCSFSTAKLQNTNFTGSFLVDANFSHAILSGAAFTCAELSGAIFTHALLKNANFEGVNIPEIRDSLFRAESIEGVIITKKFYSSDMKDLGIIHNVKAGARCVLKSADVERTINENKAKLSGMRDAAKAQEMENDNSPQSDEEVTRLEGILNTSVLEEFPPHERGLIRLRVVGTCIKDRCKNGAILSDADKDTRFNAYVRNVCLPSTPGLKRAYTALLATEKIKALECLWKQTKNVSGFRFGSLQSLCLESMISKADWTFWATRLESVYANGFDATTAGYIKILFRDPPENTLVQKMGNLTITPAAAAAPVQQAAVAPASPDPAESDPMGMGQMNSMSMGMNMGMGGMGMMPNQMGNMGMMPNQMGMGMNMGMGMGMNLGMGGMGMMPSQMSGMGMMPNQMAMMGNMGMGSMGMMPNQMGMGMMPGQMGGMGMMPNQMGMMGNMGMMPNQMGGMGMMPQEQQQQQKRKSVVPPGSTMCPECNAVFPESHAAVHKEKCGMKLVGCPSCLYQMRLIQWENHMKYCGKRGNCPLCKQHSKNVMVHLFENHMSELQANGFLKGVDRPTHCAKLQRKSKGGKK